jgi:hypothetical protein
MPDRTAEMARIATYIQAFGIQLEDPLEHYLDGTGERMNQFFQLVGAQLSVLEPDVIPYFEAGCNIVISAKKGNDAKILEALGKVAIPEELRTPNPDRLSWVNRIHEFIHRFGC